ncbi:hypothetical protein PVOR_07570 [Paenibacillus vortex V453]|uniref:Uncharacterized protein n=1 Tax=Paenibacillus vortex V453 TaxID=715225 RepID=A0A2R9SZ83_9BACL|nr:hypothetical protein [Paenibacillus vortex]EFU42695.1 hypothetical protein PVOR_07570 [Paenibacillus vortex V453]
MKTQIGSKMKYTVSAIVLILACFFIFFLIKLNNQELKVINFPASYISYDSESDLSKSADIIVLGTPAEEFQSRKHQEVRHEDGSLADFYTLTDFKIEKFLKKPEIVHPNTINDETITFTEPISIIDNNGERAIISLDGYQELEYGENYIVFLKDNGMGNYSVINMNEGKFNLQKDEISQLSSHEDKEASDRHSQIRREVLKRYINN